MVAQKRKVAAKQHKNEKESRVAFCRPDTKQEKYSQHQNCSRYEDVPTQEEMSKDVVYYDRKGMESYTAKLGPLRYHNEKREAKSKNDAS